MLETKIFIIHSWRNQQRDIKKFAEENGVLLQAYSPLGSTDSPILKDEELLAIANKHNVSVGTVLISYQNNRGVIVLPKSVTPARIAANAQLIDLTPEEINTIETMEDRGKRLRIVFPDWASTIF